MIIHVLLAASLIALVSCYLSTLWGAPWAPTSGRTVDQMLRLADTAPDDVVVDIGAGDGRVVIHAARRYGARAIGVEIDPLRWAIANARIWLLGLRDRARVLHGDLFRHDLSEADVVTLYLLQGTNQRIKPRLSQQLRDGARVVSHAFTLEGWTPTVIDEERRLFVYEMGNVGDDVQTRFV